MASLRQLRAHARQIFAAGLSSADPLEAVKRQVTLDGKRLRVGGTEYNLADIRHVYVVGCGKAAAPMALALEEIFGERIADGAIVVKYGHGAPLTTIQIVEAGHPIPDENGVTGARRIMEIVANAGVADLIIFVVSGGGSALLPMPAVGLTLADKQTTTQLLLACGATIGEVNAVRKHLSQLKGGRLAALAQPSRVISLILSDVVGDALEAIASGPTVADTTTFADCLEIIQQYGLASLIAPAVLNLLERGARREFAETPKPSNPIFQNVQNHIVGSNRLALAAAKQKAEALGYDTQIISSTIQGESRMVAQSHTGLAKSMLKQNRGVHRPICLLSGGETTVSVRGDGLGGRNQEFALAAALALNDTMSGRNDVVILGAGTDGTDGPTDAAGGIVDATTIRRGKSKGLDAEKFLARNDSYHFLKATGDLLITGPTLTNVMDLQIMLVN
jgi:hydroxypyruvate reductase